MFYSLAGGSSRLFFGGGGRALPITVVSYGRSLGLVLHRGGGGGGGGLERCAMKHSLYFIDSIRWYTSIGIPNPIIDIDHDHDLTRYAF